MRDIPGQAEQEGPEGRSFGPPPLLTGGEFCATIGLSRRWVYKRTQKGATDPLPVVRLGNRRVRFDPIGFLSTSGLSRGTVPMLRWTQPRELPESAERESTN